MVRGSPTVDDAQLKIPYQYAHLTKEKVRNPPSHDRSLWSGTCLISQSKCSIATAALFLLQRCCFWWRWRVCNPSSQFRAVGGGQQRTLPCDRGGLCRRDGMQFASFCRLRAHRPDLSVTRNPSRSPWGGKDWSRPRTMGSLFGPLHHRSRASVPFLRESKGVETFFSPSPQECQCRDGA